MAVKKSKKRRMHCQTVGENTFVTVDPATKIQKKWQSLIKFLALRMRKKNPPTKYTKAMVFEAVD